MPLVTTSHLGSLVIQYEILCSASFYATCLANDGNPSYSGGVSCQYSSERVTTLCILAVQPLYNTFNVLLNLATIAFNYNNISYLF
jgi:hypothetical protein